MLTLTFISSFIIVGFVYSLLAATTTLFYKNKPISELSTKEVNILFGRETIETRVGIFFLNLIATPLSTPAYIIAAIVTLIAYLLTNHSFFGAVGILVVVIISFLLGWKFLIRRGIGGIKLHKLKFVDIRKGDDEYAYIYAVNAKANFKNKYLKMIFTSRLPDYMWSEIQKAMTKNNIYFEDITEGESRDIKIGSITYSYFSDADFKKYGTDINKWQSFLNKAIDKQRVFVEEENQKNPDRPRLHEIYDLWNE